MTYNKIPVVFGARKRASTQPINYQYDITQILVIKGLPLPEYYEVDFCNEKDATTITIVGTEDGVAIPDNFLRTGKPIKAYVVISGSGGDVQTRYEITIPVDARPARTDIKPTPAEQLQIDSLVSAMNDAVDDARGSATAAATSEEHAAASEEAASNSEANALAYKNAASESANSATNSARNALNSANSAYQSANSASRSAANALVSEQNAAASAQAAEQAAAQSGYLYFVIGEDGHLYMDRTPNTVVDFYLDNGHLYVEEVA